MKAVILDDENDSLEYIVMLVNQHAPEINIISTYNDSVQALKEILQFKPELIILDIDMPNIDGLELISQVRNIYNPYIIFVTGYDRYMIEALRIRAFDFLIKPIITQEFIDAINRIQLDNIHQKESEIIPSVDCILINRADKCILLSISEIDYIVADGPYSEITDSEGNKIICSKPLKHFEILLNKQKLSRLQKSLLINLKNIKEITKINDGTGQVNFRSKNKLIVNHEIKNEIINILKRNFQN